MYHVITNDPMKTRKVLSCMAITAIIKNKIVYCYISEEKDALLNENDNWITSDSELI
jgi:hypothetical protein